MKTLTIQLTEEEYEWLADLATSQTEYSRNVNPTFPKIPPRRIVEQFVSDLTCSDRSVGSDERDLAQQWFDRSQYNF